jgi:pimeloyl-ACP methyl ester carboxylesterase
MIKLRTLSILSLIFWIPVIGLSQRFDLGEINGAKYKIYIPENWNGGLVMYAHGYEEIGEEGEVFEEIVDDFMEIYTSRGYAYAASNYKKQGFIVKDGIDDTEALRSYFEQTYGRPDLCIITGHSMGGIISLATIEKYPELYDGALPLCGWLAPVLQLTKRCLDMLATYDYFFSVNDGSIITKDEYVEPEEIQIQLDKKPELAKFFSQHYQIKLADLGEMLGFQQIVLHECVGWLGGLPAGNMQTIYSGFGDLNAELNKKIKRYKADQYAREYYIQNYTPTAELRDPVLALHNLYDEILPVYNYEYYEELTRLKYTDDLYVQQYVLAEGHCEFENEDISNAFGKLLEWIESGTKPAPQNQ